MFAYYHLMISNYLWIVISNDFLISVLKLVHNNYPYILHPHTIHEIPKRLVIVIFIIFKVEYDSFVQKNV